MMLTFRAGKVAAPMIFLFLAAACSREQQDWRSAEAADSVEGYSQFLERHPDSELATAARTRVAQLGEDREWSEASQADTADSYRQFLAQHPNGKWAQEARIRIQNFALNGLPPVGPPMAEAAGAGVAGPDSAAAATGPATLESAGSAAIQPSAAAAATNVAATTSAAAQAFAAPGELAQPAGAAHAPAVALSTPYVSAPNPAKPAAASGSAAATNSATTNSTTTNIATGAAAGTGAGAYGIQLGAFASAAAANSAWQQLTTRFGAPLQGLTPQVIPANTATGSLFRLQASVGDEARARALCDLLKKQSQACVPVLPH